MPPCDKCIGAYFFEQIGKPSNIFGLHSPTQKPVKELRHKPAARSTAHLFRSSLPCYPAPPAGISFSFLFFKNMYCVGS